jgi:hypothetical protein
MCGLSNEEERRRRKPEGLTAIGEVERGEEHKKAGCLSMDGLETMSEKLQDAGVLITRLLIGRNDECGRNRLFPRPPCQVISGDIDTRDFFNACDKRKVAERCR